MALIRVTESYYVTEEYDGTHARAVAIAADLGGSLSSDNASSMSVSLDGIPYTIDTGSRMVVQDDGVHTVQPQHTAESDVEYPARYAPVQRVSVAEGDESIPAAPLGGPQTVDVTIAPALSGTGYLVSPTLRGTPSVLGGHAVGAAVPLDGSTVRVTINSAVGSLTGATVHVFAIEVG